MITFKNIRWKNFLSTGNAWTEIQFDKSPSTLIIGENGSGKSTMLDALTFALFNKPFRKVSKPQLVNSINGKKLMVLYTYESDLGDGWEDLKVHNVPKYKREAALKMGTNIILYFLLN